MVDTKSNKKWSTMCGRTKSRTKSRVQCVVETWSNETSSAMGGRNINDQKVECNVWSKHSRTQSVVEKLSNKKSSTMYGRYKVNKKSSTICGRTKSRTKSRVQCVVKRSSNKKSSTMCGRNIFEHKVLVET